MVRGGLRFLVSFFRPSFLSLFLSFLLSRSRSLSVLPLFLSLLGLRGVSSSSSSSAQLATEFIPIQGFCGSVAQAACRSRHFQSLLSGWSRYGTASCKEASRLVEVEHN